PQNCGTVPQRPTWAGCCEQISNHVSAYAEATMPRAPDSATIDVGKTVNHADLGEGVIIGREAAGFVKVFFRSHGERQVPTESIAAALSWTQQVISSLKPATAEAL